MTPDMSVNQMLDSFIYIVKGSRVIDRKATDWGNAYWMGEKYVRDKVYAVADLKRYFSHRVVKSKRKTDRRDPFNDWFEHPWRFTCPTLSEAMQFADRAARGLVEPRIDIDAMIRAEISRLAPTRSDPPWESQIRKKSLIEQLQDARRRSRTPSA